MDDFDYSAFDGFRGFNGFGNNFQMQSFGPLDDGIGSLGNVATLGNFGGFNADTGFGESPPSPMMAQVDTFQPQPAPTFNAPMSVEAPPSYNAPAFAETPAVTPMTQTITAPSDEGYNKFDVFDGFNQFDRFRRQPDRDPFDSVNDGIGSLGGFNGNTGPEMTPPSPFRQEPEVFQPQVMPTSEVLPPAPEPQRIFEPPPAPVPPPPTQVSAPAAPEPQLLPEPEVPSINRGLFGPVNERFEQEELPAFTPPTPSAPPVPVPAPPPVIQPPAPSPISAAVAPLAPAPTPTPPPMPVPSPAPLAPLPIVPSPITPPIQSNASPEIGKTGILQLDQPASPLATNVGGNATEPDVDRGTAPAPAPLPLPPPPPAAPASVATPNIPKASGNMAETAVTQQIVSESPEVEAYKLDLLRQARDLAFNVQRDAAGNVIGTTTPLSQQLPGYRVAGFSPEQEAAMRAAQQTGVGAYAPYVQAGSQGVGAGMATTAEAADVLRGADVRNQFFDAQQAMRNAALAGQGITSGVGQLGVGLGYLDEAARRAAMSDVSGRLGGAYQDVETGLGALATAQNMAALASQAEMRPATAAIGQGLAGLGGAQQLALGAAGADFAGSQALLGAGIGGFRPGQQTAAFMNPYQQSVIDEAMRQINRQGQIAQQGLAAQAVRSGAFGGEREGVQRAELERGLLEQKASTIANLLNQGYSQAQANAMASFEQQQQRRMQAGQTVGQQAAQQAQLGQAAAGLYGNLAQQQVAAGQGLGQLGVQQAQLGQSAADLYARAAQGYGNLAAQTGALAGQEANVQQNIANLLASQAAQRGQVAQTAAGIYGQQAGTYQNLGQGIGALAGQQFDIGRNIAAGLGALGGQLGQLGVQQAALGQTAQALQQGDVNFLYNVGQARQALNQQAIDAERATQLQQIYAPYQQVGFLSDVYRGAPSTSMSTQVSSMPSASPFQQAVGIGLGAIGTLAGAKKAGLF